MDKLYIIILIMLGVIVGWTAKQLVGSSNSYMKGYVKGFDSANEHNLNMLRVFEIIPDIPPVTNQLPINF